MGQSAASNCEQPSYQSSYRSRSYRHKRSSSIEVPTIYVLGRIIRIIKFFFSKLSFLQPQKNAVFYITYQIIILNFQTDTFGQAVKTQIRVIIRLLHLHHMNLVVRKPVFGVSDQVQHNPGCTATEDGKRLEISD